MKIEKIEIKGLFGKKDICWKLNPQVNVLVGVNGSGKSTILGTLYSMLTKKNTPKISYLFQKAEISFSGNYLPIIRNQYLVDDIVSDLLNDSNREQKIAPILAKYLDKFMPTGQVDELLVNAVFSHLKEEYLKTHTGEIKEYTAIPKNMDLDKINTTMISTLNLSANAIFEFKGSNEEVLNILDLEMDKVLNQFNQKSDDEIQEKLMNALNFFLNMVEKHAEYKNHTIVYFDKDIQKELKFSDLSSGERQLVYMLVQVALNSTEKEKSSIILMDEPEISLHMDWQEHFINQLISLSPNSQFIIVTHSPALIMNGWNAAYLDIEEITK